MIAYLCGSNSWGGLEMNQWRNARWMAERGHQVIVFCLKDSPLFLTCQEDGIPVCAIRPHRKHYDFRAAFELFSLLRKHKVRQLILRDGWDMGLATMTKVFRLGRVRLHYFMEMQLGTVKKNPAQTLRFLLLNSWVCPLQWLVEEVQQNTWFPRRRMHLIPVGIERELFQQELSRKSARREFGLPENGLIIGLAGRIDPQKGQQVFLDAIDLLEDIPLCAVLLGSPTQNEHEDYAHSVLQRIQDGIQGKRLVHIPFRKNYAHFYKAVDVLVMASKAETCGMVTIESMLSGTPVAGSNAGGTPELLLRGKAGYLFETMNAAALAEQLRLFIANPERFSTAELHQATTQYDHHTVCQQVEKLLKIN